MQRATARGVLRDADSSVLTVSRRVRAGRGGRCDLKALQAARRVEWDRLSFDQQERYREAAAAIDAERGQAGVDEEEEGGDSLLEPVAYVPQNKCIHHNPFTLSMTDTLWI